MVVLYSEKPPQDQPLCDATADVWPVHGWVASLLSMDSMTLAMSFMMVPLFGGPPLGLGGSCARPVDVGFSTTFCVPKHFQIHTPSHPGSKTRPAPDLHASAVVKMGSVLLTAASTCVDLRRFAVKHRPICWRTHLAVPNETLGLLVRSSLTSSRSLPRVDNMPQWERP